jgi:hypothetical protein
MKLENNMKKILILMLFFSSCLYAGDFENYINYKTLKEYKNYYSQGQIEINKTPTSFIISTKKNKKYLLFIYSTHNVDVAIYDGSFSDLRKFYGKGIMSFKASNETVMVVVNGEGYTKINWGEY